MAIRTTLTLDDDVARMLERAVAEQGIRTKELVNSILRAGLQAGPARRRGPKFRMSPVDLGRCLLGDVADVATALAAAEGDRFR